jgi:hypothetical protein
MALPAYAGVYKWVDEKGNVHYSEQPPTKGDHTQLSVQPAQSDPQPYSENKAVSQLRQMEADKSERNRIQYQKQRLETERQIRERDRETADPKYWEREKQREADEKTARDDATVADCKRNRETYCDKGAERIHDEAQWRTFMGDIDRNKARSR